MGQLLGALNAIGRQRNQIAEKTRQATDIMRARCEQLSLSIHGTAAVSEESAASAEEVSASTEEQTASVEQMSAGAQELAALATGLTDLVGRFTVDAGDAAAKAGPRTPVRAVHAA